MRKALLIQKGFFYPHPMKNIAIFASGSGTNAAELISYFQSKGTAKIRFVITNNPNAGVINRAKALGVSSFVFSKAELNDVVQLKDFLRQNEINLIVLAGYLKMIPKELIEAYPQAIVNIHPALLPEFGGKGMHGIAVHEAVVAAGKKESGISIHYVNEAYDEGQIIFQATCPVMPDDKAEELAKRVLKLEHMYFPKVVESLVL